MQNPKLYLVFDLETLGLYPEIHQIAEFGGVLLDGTTLAEVSSYQAYFLPREPVVYEQKALDVNHLTIDFLQQNGKPGKTVCQEISMWLRKAVRSNFDIHTICDNKTFDLGFIEPEFRRWHMELPVHYANKFDIKDQCRDFNIPLDKIKLKTMCAYYNIPYEDAHGALPDARMTAEVFRRFENIRRTTNIAVEKPLSLRI